MTAQVWRTWFITIKIIYSTFTTFISKSYLNMNQVIQHYMFTYKCEWINILCAILLCDKFCDLSKLGDLCKFVAYCSLSSDTMRAVDFSFDNYVHFRSIMKVDSSVTCSDLPSALTFLSFKWYWNAAYTDIFSFFLMLLYIPYFA